MNKNIHFPLTQRNFLLLFILLAAGSTSYSQQIVRSSLSCFGNAVTESGILFRQTVGQPSSTQVVSNNGVVLRQGFQQPVSLNVGVVSKECTLYMSPNPTMDFTSLEYAEEIGEHTISVFDMTGKLHVRVTTSENNYKMDVRKLQSGVYLVNVVSKSGYHCNQKLIILL